MTYPALVKDLTGLGVGPGTRRPNIVPPKASKIMAPRNLFEKAHVSAKMACMREEAMILFGVLSISASVGEFLGVWITTALR